MEHYLGLPPDGSAHGSEIDFLIGIIHWVMYVLFAGWGVYLVYTLVRYRSRPGARADYRGTTSHVSTYSEVAVIVIEGVLLLGFSIPLWAARVAEFPPEETSTVVRVVAEQFAWNIHYPGPDGAFGRTAIDLVGTDNPLGLDRADAAAADDITTINQLNLPVDRPAIVHLMSKDVIHSFGIPPYRVKQDIIPGLSIPLWWTPVKTTDQIREEMATVFSVADAAASTGILALPQSEEISLSPGTDKSGFYLLTDQTDAEGSTILSADDELTADNAAILLEGGISKVLARRGAGLDGYISIEELAAADGSALVAAHELLSEDVVTRLVAAGITKIRARKASFLDPWVLMENAAGPSGEQIAARLDFLTEEIISALVKAGASTVAVGPATPTEIACAQLCGLGHYRMRGYVTVQTPEAYDAWVEEQQQALRDAAAQSDQGAETDAETGAQTEAGTE